jgi:hypothetical protein
MSQVYNRSVLLDMLTYCRPAGSETEQSFIDKYIATLPGVTNDRHGNWHVTIGELSPVLWSCHTDTVHHKDGRQTLHVDTDIDTVELSKRSRKRSSCLGADDTAGVFLMWSMVHASIPGHYVFHYGEEVGGQGSSSFAYEWPDELSHIRFAVALDRRGTDDVITHQGARRTASESFAQSLAVQLNTVAGLAYSPSSHGIYTDTYEYATIVPECTNLSVGYYHEHSTREYLDIGHVQSLLSALCALDQTALVEERVPTPEDTYRWTAVGSHVWSTVSYGTVLTCEYCRMGYYDDESNAADRETFCSEDCETQYLNEARYRAIYLTDEYADVQTALLPFTRTIQ